MDTLRLILLAVGIAFILAIYFFEKARRKRADERYSRWGGSEEKDYIPRHNVDMATGMGAVTASSDQDYDEDREELEQEELAREEALKDITDELQQLEDMIASKDDDVVEQLEMDTLTVEQPVTGDIPEEPDEVIVINVFAANGSVMTGPDILDAAMKHDMQFGDMGFFHRLDETAHTTFSMANALQPGSFELANMETLATRGLVFFMSLPGRGDPLANFDSMMTTIRDMADGLQAQLYDETRSILTRQGVDEIRTRISEYKLKKSLDAETV